MTIRHDYNPDALQRIRNGACARDLGWDEQFYRKVCRDHGLSPIASRTIAKPEVSLAREPEPQLEALCFLPDIQTIVRNSIKIEITQREVNVFKQLASALPGTFITGKAMGDALNISREYVGVIINGMRRQLSTLRVVVASKRGWPGGYSLQDAVSKKPLIVSIRNDAVTQ